MIHNACNEGDPVGIPGSGGEVTHKATDRKAGRKDSFRLRHVSSENADERVQPSGDQSDPDHGAQATASPGIAPDPGKPDALVAAIGDLLLSEWMAENLPILRKRALTPVRTSANTPGPSTATEDAS